MREVTVEWTGGKEFVNLCLVQSESSFARASGGSNLLIISLLTADDVEKIRNACNKFIEENAVTVVKDGAA